MSFHAPPFPELQGWFHHYWPALVLAWVAYMALRYLLRRVGHSPAKLSAAERAVHEIMTSLACTEAQAKRLLAAYGGDTAKAINEVKTGRSVMPGEEVSAIATFGGELKRYTITAEQLRLDSQDGESRIFPTATRVVLAIGVVDPQQRADSQGQARADRGPTYGQLYLQKEDGWHRYLLNSARMDYVFLAERKQNSAVRNFRLVLQELVDTLPTLEVDSSWEIFQEHLRAPHFKTLAEFEAAAIQKLKDS